jgi:hypothetical protein
MAIPSRLVNAGGGTNRPHRIALWANAGSTDWETNTWGLLRLTHVTKDITYIGRYEFGTRQTSLRDVGQDRMYPSLAARRASTLFLPSPNREPINTDEDQRSETCCATRPRHSQGVTVQFWIAPKPTRLHHSAMNNATTGSDKLADPEQNLRWLAWESKNRQIDRIAENRMRIFFVVVFVILLTLMVLRVGSR